MQAQQRSSGVGLKWAFPGVVVGVVVPLSVSVGDALELLITDVVVSVSVWSWSVDTFFTGDETDFFLSGTKASVRR